MEPQQTCLTHAWIRLLVRRESITRPSIRLIPPPVSRSEGSRCAFGAETSGGMIPAAPLSRSFGITQKGGAGSFARTPYDVVALTSLSDRALTRIVRIEYTIYVRKGRRDWTQFQRVGTV